MKIINKLLLLGLFTMFLYGCSDNNSNPVEFSNSEAELNKKNPANGTTIYDVASTNPNFSILAAAVDAAGFDKLLDGNRQFTVFAPTNAAFETLLANLGLSAEELLADTELLKTVLSYHVSPGQKKSGNVLSSGRVNTLLGSFIFSKIENSVPKVGNDVNGYAAIETADLRVSNGYIHIIDAVLIP